MTYQPGIPTGFLNLDQDYQNIQNNFTVLNNVFQVDHTTLTNVTAQKGYHTAIHLIPQSTPTNAPGYGQIYSTTINDGISNDQTLFYQTGTGNLNLQLTRNFLPVINTNGYTFLAGGLILQWGFRVLPDEPPSTGNVLFNLNNINFPNACFSVQATLYFPSGNPPEAGGFAVSAITKTGFNWSFTGADFYTRFYWWAIGN